MKLSIYITIAAIVTFVYAVGLLFFPAQFIGNFGITLDAGATVITRLLGSILFANAVFYWMVRNLPASNAALNALLWTSVLLNVINGIVIAMGISNGVGNNTSWGTVAVNAIFALVSLYFVTKKR